MLWSISHTVVVVLVLYGVGFAVVTAVVRHVCLGGHGGGYHLDCYLTRATQHIQRYSITTVYVHMCMHTYYYGRCELYAHWFYEKNKQTKNNFSIYCQNWHRERTGRVETAPISRWTHRWFLSGAQGQASNFLPCDEIGNRSWARLQSEYPPPHRFIVGTGPQAVKPR